MPEATVSDVRTVIDTSLEDSEISSFLEDAEFDAEKAITDYSNELSTTEQSQLEKYYAALLIRTTKEKGLSSQSAESRSMNYESSMTASELRVRVDQRDPSGTLAQSVQRDSNRYVGSTSRE